MIGKNGQARIEAAAEETAGVVAETGEMLKGTANEAGSTAQDYVRAAGRQAGVTAQTAYGAAQTAYSQGSELLDAVGGFVRGNVWSSVLIAAAVGYGLASLVKSSR